MKRKSLTKFNTHLKKKQKQKPPESRHRRNIPQHNKSHIRQTHSRHYPQWQKSESIFSKIRNKKRVPTLLLFNTVLDVLAKAIIEDKK